MMIADVHLHEQLLILLNRYWIAGYLTAHGAVDASWPGLPFEDATDAQKTAWLNKATDDLIGIMGVGLVTPNPSETVQ